MQANGHLLLWGFWLVLTLGLAAVLAYELVADASPEVFMPGPLSNGHHQLQGKCNVCHTDPLGGGEVLQKACVDCHGEDRKKPFDSHPRSKFTDPRNADRLQNINALRCVSCHTEHRPEITLKDGLTQPLDVCAHCHQKIAEDRPSHAGMPFDTCKSSGCHNFHNNRALYTDFLVKHLHKPKLLEKHALPAREFAARLDEVADYPRERYPLKALSLAQADAPAGKLQDKTLNADWLGTAHAKAGVNCSACHMTRPEQGPGVWNDKPGHESCATCHGLEVKRFMRGKHGMRLAAELPAMTPGDARLPMKDDAAHKELGCSSCHGAHKFDVQQAAVESCLACHDDDHTLAYKQSPHFDTWKKAVAGELSMDEAVSCASCHMPRISYDVNDYFSRIMVDHNQSAALSPNSKMIRPACLHCHSLEYSIDALADPELIKNNFKGDPETHVISMELAEKDHLRAMKETEALRAQ